MFHLVSLLLTAIADIWIKKKDYNLAGISKMILQNNAILNILILSMM